MRGNYLSIAAADKMIFHQSTIKMFFFLSPGLVCAYACRAGGFEYFLNSSAPVNNYTDISFHTHAQYSFFIIRLSTTERNPRNKYLLAGILCFVKQHMALFAVTKIHFEWYTPSIEILCAEDFLMCSEHYGYSTGIAP